MATDRQIAANQRNAERSTGPKTEEGKARIRLNATKHGLASENVDLEAGFSPEFLDRREKWAAEQNPVGEAGHWALDRVVAATFRIERCERSIDEIITDHQERAALAWEQNRAVEAAKIAGRLAKDPVLASRQLQTTLAGVCLLIEAWLGLAAALQSAEGWSESDASTALDLLGVPTDLRKGMTLIDAPDGTDPIAFRRELTFEEIDRLETLRDEALTPLDESDRRRAMAGHSALLSKPARLVLRYEREAWNRYRESMKELKEAAQAPPTVIVAPIKSPVVVEPPVVEEGRPTTPDPIPATAKVDQPSTVIPIAASSGDSDGRVIPVTLRVLAPERTQFGEISITQASGAMAAF